MWHIRPSDLIPHKLQSSGSFGRHDSIGETILKIGSIPLLLGSLFGVPFGAGALGAAVSPGLALPAGFIGVGLGVVLVGALVENTVLCGIVEAASYAGITLLLGLEGNTDPTPAWISAGVVAAFFLWATFSAWKKQRR